MADHLEPITLKEGDEVELNGVIGRVKFVGVTSFAPGSSCCFNDNFPSLIILGNWVGVELSKVTRLIELGQRKLRLTIASRKE
jgi:hypothetical protein